VPTVMIFTDVLHEKPGRHVDLLHEAGFTVQYPENPNLVDEDETIKVLNGVSATIAGGEPYSDRVVSALPDLRVVSRWGVGVDQIDLDAVTKAQILVTITATANHEAVAEHTMALLLGVSRKLIQRNHQISQGYWIREASQPLRGKTLGLIGLGRIGRSVAVRAAGFSMRLIAHEAFPDVAFARRHRIELVDLDSLLRESDYISLHVPLNETNRGLINRQNISKMKKGSFLINTARGGLVVEKDLVEALRNGHLGGAGLDVFVQEPIDSQHPLIQLDNVLATDHTAGIDIRSVEDMAVESAQNIVDLFNGKWPDSSVVNGKLKSSWKW